ncbi:MAG: hypothetical protein RL761_333 [Pseudomonadota bacterium]|jgi:hypothetical protein
MSEDTAPSKEATDDSHLKVSNQSSIYQGLSETSKIRIILVASLIAVLNLMAAWYFALQTSHELTDYAKDMVPFSAWVTDTGKDLSPAAKHDLSARAITLMSSLKLVANKQSLTLTSFGGAFALIAIGFALFIIGADGAFRLMATAPGKAQFALSSTAPGLLCFVIAACLLAVGVNHPSELRAPTLPEYGIASPALKANTVKPCEKLNTAIERDNCLKDQSKKEP